VCHDFPGASASGTGGSDAGKPFLPLADRIAAETGFGVMVGMLRGMGESEGDFSASGWLEDLGFLIDREVGTGGWAVLVGYGLGGAVALRTAVTDERVRAVAVVGAPADLTSWSADPEAAAVRCRVSGVIRTPGFPPDPEGWARDVESLQPHDAVQRLGDRSLLVVHGSEDRTVSTAAARTLADEARTSGTVDLRIVPGAGHGVWTDPRSVATVIGWLERQR
jgi:putative redox protein